MKVSICVLYVYRVLVKFECEKEAIQSMVRSLILSDITSVKFELWLRNIEYLTKDPRISHDKRENIIDSLIIPSITHKLNIQGTGGTASS